jgi:repressor LexA
LIGGQTQAGSEFTVAQAVNKLTASARGIKARTMTVVKDFTPRTRQMVNVPIVGRVAAGTPILAIENKVGEIMVDAMIARGNCFALEVCGDSMIDVDINDGDYVVVRQQQLSYFSFCGILRCQ